MQIQISPRIVTLQNLDVKFEANSSCRLRCSWADRRTELRDPLFEFLYNSKVKIDDHYREFENQYLPYSCNTFK